MNEVQFAWTHRSKIVHIAAGSNKKVACRIAIRAPLSRGPAIPEGKRLCARCVASQNDIGQPA